MAGKYALIFLCAIFLKQTTSAAINGENKIDLNNFHHFIDEKFPVLYTITVENSIPVLKETIEDMESLHDNNPEVISRTTEIKNFIKEVESAAKPLKLDKQHSMILKWENLFIRDDLSDVVNLLFSLSLEKHGLVKIIIEFGDKYKPFYEEFNTKLNELWHTLTEAQKADNVKFTAWHSKYEKLEENQKVFKFRMWGELFSILENNNNEL